MSVFRKHTSFDSNNNSNTVNQPDVGLLQAISVKILKNRNKVADS